MAEYKMQYLGKPTESGTRYSGYSVGPSTRKRYSPDNSTGIPKRTKTTGTTYIDVKDEKARLTKIVDEIIVDRINEFDNKKMKQKLENLKTRIDSVMENHEVKFTHLYGEIQQLKHEIESLKAKNERLDATVALAQSTFLWEAHLARFVITDPEVKIGKIGRFRQMSTYLKKNKVENHYWKEIQTKVNKWTDSHWAVVKSVREERNGIAHPELIDLYLIEQEITEMSLDDQEKMKNMIDMLKMMASLMKFGRLAAEAELPQQLSNDQKKALKKMTLWNRKFEQIGGLQNIEHEEAKEYLQRYLGESHPALWSYFNVVDSIKEANGKRLGKLAKDFAEHNRRKASTSETSKAFEKLKELLPNDENTIEALDPSIAKLHIPDFLPKELWKDGIEIVENYKKLVKSH